MIIAANPLVRILRFRRRLRSSGADAIIAFLSTSAALAELASVPGKKWKLIVSERNNVFIEPSRKAMVHLRLHRLADHVTTNAFATSDSILRVAPFLKDKISTIYNGLDTAKFSPSSSSGKRRRARIVVASSHQTHKNAKNLILALKVLRDKHRIELPEIVWYGSDVSYYDGSSSEAYVEARTLIHSYDLQRDFQLNPPVSHMENIYREADALMLPSYREGMPNVVCEAMACGLPILMGRVSDYQVLTEGNGAAFDPHSVESIAEALRLFLSLDSDELDRMRVRSREKALTLFSKERLADEYEKLIQ